MTTPPPPRDLSELDGLPDEAMLTRLANAYFSALPGEPTTEQASSSHSTPGGQLENVVVPGFDDSAVPGGTRRKSGSSFYFLDQLHDQVATHLSVPELTTQPPDLSSRFQQTDQRPPFDVNTIRRDFPILSEQVNGRPLIWLDNAATTQKPQVVIDRLAHFYAHENSNIHRAAHTLAARATDAYEQARDTVARFLGAGSSEEIIFVRGTTEAINLVAATWGRRHLGAGDEIIISHLEHHANIVPWQLLAEETEP